MLAVRQELLEYNDINIETRYQNFDPSVTYGYGDVTFYDHYYYKSVIDGNVGNNPWDSPTLWLRWSISNRYAQIDLRATTETVWNVDTAISINDDALVCSYQNNNYATISFGNITGTSVLVELLDGATVVWSSEKIIPIRSGANTWYNFYYDSFDRQGVKAAAYFQLPTSFGTTIRTTITAYNGTAACGYCVAGFDRWLGDTLFGLSMGLDDYSLITIDDWGIKSIQKRNVSRFMDIDVDFPSGQLMEMMYIASDLHGDIVLFIGDESADSQFDNLFLLGYIENYTTVLPDPVITKGSFSIREVI